MPDRDDQPDRRSDPRPRPASHAYAKALPNPSERAAGREGVARAREILARAARVAPRPR